MELDEFEETSSDIIVYTESEYERQTGLKLDDEFKRSKIRNKRTTSKNIKQNTKKSIQRTEEANKKKEKNNKKEEEASKKKKENKQKEKTTKKITEKEKQIENVSIGTGVIRLDDNVKTNNTFIKSVMNNKIAENKQEIAEFSKINKDFPFISLKTILTSAENQLYHKMRNGLRLIDKVVICPKVRLADIVSVDSRVTTDRQFFYKICSKHVDFVICDGHTLNIICIVELDDYTHETEDGMKRDNYIGELFMTVGIPLIRIKTRIAAVSKEDINRIDYLINSYYAPKCPQCGAEMEARVSRTGHRFYSCKRFPICRGNIDIDSR